ncbi:CinA family protein [uncultured Modestobacter sp.]|uniref:CinA family protein n=1 Tax=uncultured Modestobacter sp. TaxID=380048 RepID=UPI002626E464|nr:nicotinamide-nucleotide amidohydrolase family protein [uncultured Modestobacter sp.]
MSAAGEPGTAAAPPAAQQLHEALLARGETVAAAESLTAGLFCATLAEVPGASATLRGGAVVYATDLKSTLAGVAPELLAAHGPVSEPAAAALAEGIRSRCSATWGIGLTGVAGPDPVDGHTPGRVYLGLSDGVLTVVHELDLPGDRTAVRAGAVREAVQRLLARLVEHPVPPPSGAGKPGGGGGVTPSADVSPPGR